MNNLSNVPIEKLETLPKMEKSNKRSYKRGSRAWRRVHAWINSKIGKNVDVVFSDFKQLPWLPAEYKTFESFTSYVQHNTFLENEEIFYIPSNWSGIRMGNAPRPIHELASYCLRHVKALYVHPLTKSITEAKPKWEPTPKTKPTEFCLGHQNRLKKIDGVWVKINYKQLNRKELKKLSLENDYVGKPISRRKWANIGYGY